jgi:DNA-binding transcriptional ArsR family regulator
VSDEYPTVAVRTARMSNNAPARKLIKTDGRAPEVVAFEEAVIGLVLDSALLFGVPKSVAVIYGLCFASPEPLGFSDISARLTLSSGSISQGLRVLREAGVLKVAQYDEEPDEATKINTAIPEPSSRRNSKVSHLLSSRKRSELPSQYLSPSREYCGTRMLRYEPNLELRKLILRWIDTRLEKQLSKRSKTLNAIISAIPTESDNSVRVLEQRIDTLKAWHDKTRILLPLVRTILTSRITRMPRILARARDGNNKTI